MPVHDNFYAALNSAVFSDGSFVYIPKGTRCPMELSTYFRIKNGNAGSCTATLKATGRSAAGIAIADQTFTVAANTGDVTIGNLPVSDFGMTVTVEVSVSTTVTAAAFK